MNITVTPVKSGKDYSEFIFLPAKIHRNHPQWVPPIWLDEKAFFNPKKNKSFSHCDTIMLLTRKGRETVGRIMGIIHHKYNERMGEKKARFGYLECYNDPLVSHLLISAVENWARAKGMTHLVGPYGFSDKDPQGLLIEGFEHQAMIASSCNFPYLVELVEREGFTKEVDCLAFKMPADFVTPPVFDKIYDRIMQNNKLEVLEFTRRKQIYPWVTPILDLMNECFADIYGFTPLDEREKQEFTDRYMPVLDPRFVKVVLRDGQVRSFFIALPNFTRGIQKSKGYLLPFGLFHILRAMKKTDQLDFMLGGIKPGFQGLGLDVVMGMKMRESAKKAGFKHIEGHLVLETNHKMLAEYNRVNAVAHKRFRVFKKEL